MLVAKIAEVYNPITQKVWGVNITEKDIPKILELAESGDVLGTHKYNKKRKGDHMKRIAYFVKHGIVDPIDIDVGCPSFRASTVYVGDGNHRLAAAIIRGDKRIPVDYSGEVYTAVFQFGLRPLKVNKVLIDACR